MTEGHEVLSREIVSHGAYLCLRVPGGSVARAAGALPVPALAERLGLRNEYHPAEAPPRESVAFLRRSAATPGAMADDGVLHADAIVHVAARTPAAVDDFCAEVTRLLGPGVSARILRGVVRPKNYTSAAMNNFAYAHAVVQRPGPAMPNAFLIPMSKTAAWWSKGWMERHTYFLPRYDADGRMVSEGHALASAAGIPCLLRRTYKNLDEPAPADGYDFVTYFECADADVPTFHAVCASLRDVQKNPEWSFVREGPTWHGRRVPTWEAMFEPAAA